jgi:hypothetical protein
MNSVRDDIKDIFREKYDIATDQACDMADDIFNVLCFDDTLQDMDIFDYQNKYAPVADVKPKST